MPRQNPFRPLFTQFDNAANIYPSLRAFYVQATDSDRLKGPAWLAELKDQILRGGTFIPALARHQNERRAFFAIIGHKKDKPAADRFSVLAAQASLVLCELLDKDQALSQDGGFWIESLARLTHGTVELPFVTGPSTWTSNGYAFPIRGLPHLDSDYWDNLPISPRGIPYPHDWYVEFDDVIAASATACHYFAEEWELKTTQHSPHESESAPRTTPLNPKPRKKRGPKPAPRSVHEKEAKIYIQAKEAGAAGTRLKEFARAKGLDYRELEKLMDRERQRRRRRTICDVSTGVKLSGRK